MERSSRGVHGGRLSHDRYHHGVHCIGGMDVLPPPTVCTLMAMFAGRTCGIGW